MKHLEKELEKSVWEIIIDLQRKNRDLERELENIRELSRQQGKAFDECLKDYRGLVKDYMKQEEENKELKEHKKNLIRADKKKTEHIDELEEENELLKQCLDKLMFAADVVNVKIHWELWDYVYVRGDKQFKLNVKD